METSITASSYDCVDDARRLLARNSQPCQRVISVDRDSILFITPTGRPRTAWLHLRPGGSKLLLRFVPGFGIDPPEDWLNGPQPEPVPDPGQFESD